MTNERATRKAIVNACQFPLSIIVVGVGDGPWEMMKVLTFYLLINLIAFCAQVFDESLPKRPWDNFHFVEFNEVINDQAKSRIDPELSFAIHSLLEVPDQYVHIRKMGLLGSRGRPLAHYSPRSRSPKLMTLNVDREK